MDVPYSYHSHHGPQGSGQCDAPPADTALAGAVLEDIASLLDDVCGIREQLLLPVGMAGSDVDHRFSGVRSSPQPARPQALGDKDHTHTAFRRDLFSLIDEPEQGIWERVREYEVAPAFMMGCETPSPLGRTLGDIVYSFGITDVTCPPRQTLIEALRWAVVTA